MRLRHRRTNEDDRTQNHGRSPSGQSLGGTGKTKAIAAAAPRALPDRRKFLQLSMIGNGHRPRGSRLAVASNIAPRPQPMSTFVA